MNPFAVTRISPESPETAVDDGTTRFGSMSHPFVINTRIELVTFICVVRVEDSRRKMLGCSKWKVSTICHTLSTVLQGFFSSPQKAVSLPVAVSTYNLTF
ncbi:hypothetical protein BLNAU_14133 [Blattamonas nauphoetae]|uniref:Uncharacterized protein n=1 Tax=Blattamonas nauphoetae TaxID=2049346 RepID=A0ABQ9XHZ9_9EUKA|nr:hypothetical protein BLNAU_14133 [Blattamonas nauphoetae]